MSKEEILWNHVDAHCFLKKGCVEAVEHAMQEYADQEVKKDLRDKDELQKAIAEGNATLSRIRSLVFADPNDPAWAMEEIRKVLGAAAVLGEIEGEGNDPEIEHNQHLNAD